MVKLPVNPDNKTIRMKSKGEREREREKRHDWHKIYYLFFFLTTY